MLTILLTAVILTAFYIALAVVAPVYPGDDCEGILSSPKPVWLF